VFTGVDGYHEVLLGEEVAVFGPPFHDLVRLLDLTRYLLLAVVVVVGFVLDGAQQFAHEEGGEDECLVAGFLGQEGNLQEFEVVLDDGVVEVGLGLEFLEVLGQEGQDLVLAAVVQVQSPLESQLVGVEPVHLLDLQPAHADLLLLLTFVPDEELALSPF
jgi:hypothetical protein